MGGGEGEGGMVEKGGWQGRGMVGKGRGYYITGLVEG